MVRHLAKSIPATKSRVFAISLQIGDNFGRGFLRYGMAGRVEYQRTKKTSAQSCVNII